METRKLYVPMKDRGYCVTDSEQKYLACRYGMDVDYVRKAIQEIGASIEASGTVPRTANDVKRRIDAHLKAVM